MELFHIILFMKQNMDYTAICVFIHSYVVCSDHGLGFLNDNVKNNFCGQLISRFYAWVPSDRFTVSLSRITLLTLQTIGIVMAKKNRQQTPRNIMGRQGEERRSFGNSSMMATKMDSMMENCREN